MVGDDSDGSMDTGSDSGRSQEVQTMTMRKQIQVLASNVEEHGVLLGSLAEYRDRLSEEVFKDEAGTLHGRVSTLEDASGSRPAGGGQPIKVAAVFAVLTVVVSVALSVVIYSFLLGNARQQISSLTAKVRQLEEKAEPAGFQADAKPADASQPTVDRQPDNQSETKDVKDELESLRDGLTWVQQTELAKLKKQLDQQAGWIEQIISLLEKLTTKEVSKK